MTRNQNIAQTEGDDVDDSYQMRQKFPASAIEGSRRIDQSGSNL